MQTAGKKRGKSAQGEAGSWLPRRTDSAFTTEAAQWDQALTSCP